MIADPLRDTLPRGIRSRRIDNINGLSMHILEAGFETKGRPCLLLLHGFPELAYSWRKVMLPFAEAGYRVIAPDQRGYGRTTGWDAEYDGDLASFRLTNLVRDAIGLVFALGYRSADVVGHDYGASVAAWCALIRPDVFKSVTLMSAPFSGPPQLPFDTAGKEPAPKPADLDAALAALDPPRQHYQRYYSTRDANADMWHAPQGMHDFLRAYYHHKSADWTQNKPHPLKAQTAGELAQLPAYYIMRADKGMAQTVAEEMPTNEQIAANTWLPDSDLAVYASEYQRNGFQGGLQWYRNRFEPAAQAQLQLYAGRTIDVPSCFISGKSDWGTYQVAGALETMQTKACTNMRDCHLVDGAGHWVQQEQPQAVARLLLDFLKTASD